MSSSSAFPSASSQSCTHASHASRCIAASAVRSFRGAHFRKTPAAAARARSASGSSGAALTERSASSSASLAPAASSSPSHYGMQIRFRCQPRVDVRHNQAACLTTLAAPSPLVGGDAAKHCSQRRRVTATAKTSGELEQRVRRNEKRDSTAIQVAAAAAAMRSPDRADAGSSHHMPRAYLPAWQQQHHCPRHVSQQPRAFTLGRRVTRHFHSVQRRGSSVAREAPEAPETLAPKP